jgi:hypothetical protein
MILKIDKKSRRLETEPSKVAGGVQSSLINEEGPKRGERSNSAGRCIQQQLSD